MTARSSLASATSSAAACIAALSLGLSSTARAAMPGATVSVSVTTHDLDLARGDGRAKLERRLRIAAVEACGESSAADLAGKRVVRRCRAELVRIGQEQAIALAAGQARLAAR